MTGIREELETIREKGNGFLRPQEVVEYARNPDTALHSHFEWDDDEAAEKYRLVQARALIRVVVTVEPNTSEKIRAYVSLMDDRHKEGGYRVMAKVIDDVMLTDKLMEDAFKELSSFRRKYNILRSITGISGIMDAINAVVPDKSEETSLSA